MTVRRKTGNLSRTEESYSNERHQRLIRNMDTEEKYQVDVGSVSVTADDVRFPDYGNLGRYQSNSDTNQ